MVYRAICDILEQDGRITEAIGCFRQMQAELTEDSNIHDERIQWELSEWSRLNATNACLSTRHRV